MNNPLPPHLRHPNKAARASFAKHTINTVIPHILQNNTRARLGVESTERIYFNPASIKIKGKPPSTNTTTGGPKQGKNSGKITGYFSPIRKSQEEGEGPSSLARDGKKDATNNNNDATKPDDVNSSSKPVVDTDQSSASSSSQPRVSVIQADTLNAAQAFVDPKTRDQRIAILNMASFLRPGGGVMSGAIAQEESLCLRSTLYPSLDERFYRLPKFGGLFTKDILVFRDSDNKDLPKADWFFVDVISVAALKNPDLTTRNGKEVYDYEQDKEEMISKIKLILREALRHHVTHLILGALGCGAYHNPPEEVAKMFRRVILGDKQGQRAMDLTGLKEIVFAIFDDGINLKVFREILDTSQPAVAKASNIGIAHDDAEIKTSSGKIDVEMGGMTTA